MRVLLLALACLGMTGPAAAQTAKGLAQEAVARGWLLSLTAAQDMAQRTGKPILVVLRCEP